ncbi:hypothetical protein PPYR_05343 [Photinus pyralis]|uniref:MULE transposase domain-containing protein n=1 Tax=Photinus pyralis TaxID=7054 RepID=A0A5N4AUJ7_PHOPY|nr:hypothetical protein PPYR_05343 [Photinus pyralis]
MFLLADSGPHPNRILIFGRERILILNESNHWFVDGTFKTTPPLFYQVYVVLAERLGYVHPLLYALLPNKQQATYSNMLAMIKDIMPQLPLNPRYISCDFELAAILAFQRAFDNVEIHGCFFHLTKNLKKQLGRLHLTARYNTDPEFAVLVRSITSLAFVPIQDLDQAVDRLSEHLPVDLQALLQWFEDIGRPNRRGNGRRDAMFPPEMWSVYQRVINNQDRTNNHAEAAHRRLQVELGMNHPTLWKFITAQVQKGRDVVYEQLVAGRTPPKKLKKYRDADSRIRRIVTDYHNRNVIAYLRGISINYEMEP